MDWYDEQLTNIGIAPDSATGPGGADLSNDDIMEAIGMAGIDVGQDWVTATAQAYSDYRNAAESQRMYEPPRAEGDKTPDKKTAEGGIIGRISNFVDKNKSLSEMLLKGVAGAAMGNQAKKSAEIAAQSRLEELKLKNQQEREKDAQVSASVSGLRAPQGLIGRPQQQLRRADGSLVYQNGRVS